MRLNCLARARREGVQRCARTERETERSIRLNCLARARREGVRRCARTERETETVERSCGRAVFARPSALT